MLTTIHMYKTILTSIILLLSLSIFSCHTGAQSKTSKSKIPVATSDYFKFQGEAINQSGYDIWGSSPIRDQEGNIHLFSARWPGNIPFLSAWKYNSEIAHYVGKTPVGPFKYVNTVASSKVINGKWQTNGFHNPNIRKIGDNYALVYIANDGAKQHGSTQFIGMMLTDDINGDWTSVPNVDTPILQTPKDSAIWCYNSGCGVTNPSLLEHPNGRFYLYFKAMTGPRPAGKVKMGVAIADQLEGPYVIQKSPITSNDKAIEDGYAFLWRNHVCLLTTDNHGILERGGGLLWVSKDGKTFDAKPMSGFHDFGKVYLNGNIPAEMKSHYGNQVKFERPQILMDKEGEIEYLYCPSGVAIDGSDGTNCYVLKYEE